MRLLTLILVFLPAAFRLTAQQAEYTYYRWSEQPSAVHLTAKPDTLRPYCYFSYSQTELVTDGYGPQSEPALHILLHQKIYFPGWQAIRNLPNLKIPGTVLSMKARLYETNGTMIDTATSRLLTDLEEPNLGIHFTGRMPGTVLEFIVISRIRFHGFFEYAWQLPVAEPSTAQLILPELFQYECRAYFTQTGFERSARDGKIFLNSRLTAMSADVFAESGPYGTYTPRLRYIIFRPGSPSNYWDRLYSSFMTLLDEAPLVAPSEKISVKSGPEFRKEGSNRKPLSAPTPIPRRMKRAVSPSTVIRKAGISKKTEVAYIPGKLQRYIAGAPSLQILNSAEDRQTLLHRCLAESGIPHRFYLGSPSPALPFDTTFLWYPDLMNMLIYLPLSGEWIVGDLQGISKSPPERFIGRTCWVMDANMPGKPSSGYRFEPVPHPCNWVNEENSELHWNGDSVMRFMRYYKGFPAREFTEYGSLEPELRSNLDIAIARSFASDAWLLEARAESMGTPVPEYMVFNGRFSSRSLVEFQDSVMYLHAGRFIGFSDTTDHPQWRSTPIDVLGRFSRTKSLYIQIPKGWELAEMPFNDTAFQYTSGSSPCPLHPDLHFTVRVEVAGKDRIRITRSDSYLHASYSGEGAAHFWKQSKMGNNLLPITLKFRKKR